ncbi:PIN-like domain-containing protein [Flavobacterium sp. FlaQc-47]|uniref:PIN-like domain-containing protein n=1 Tax=Flavobacterium sp. FlaQc-47 TaxID=3374180 RepID=UPI0037571374
MDGPTFDIYNLDETREKKLWENAVFVFDSSALLDFYFLPIITRTKIFDNLFTSKLKSRLWIPSHVKFEYEKNRQKIITKPISENYKPLKDENLKFIKTSVKEIENRTIDLKNKTIKDDKHPHIPQEDIEKYLILIEEFKNASSTFEDLILKKISAVEAEIKLLPENDDVAKAIHELFQIGRYYTFEEIIEITKEGKHRFEFSIPPGYEDLKDKDKKGTQIFGDLIIWKQIIEFAKENNKPIIFICNDVKEDWCYIQKNNTEKRIERPREELIKEIYDNAKVEFWMYNQPQFLHKSNQYYEAEIEKQNIDALSEYIVNRNGKLERELVFECNNCGYTHKYLNEDFKFHFECIDSNERNMGRENEYEASEYVECNDCGKIINLKFTIWEYPLGIQNYEEIEIQGAKLISSFDIMLDFESTQQETCAKCGNSFNDIHHINICDDCEKEYEN